MFRGATPQKAGHGGLISLFINTTYGPGKEKVDPLDQKGRETFGKCSILVEIKEGLQDCGKDS